MIEGQIPSNERGESHETDKYQRSLERLVIHIPIYSLGIRLTGKSPVKFNMTSPVPPPPTPKPASSSMPFSPCSHSMQLHAYYLHTLIKPGPIAKRQVVLANQLVLQHCVLEIESPNRFLARANNASVPRVVCPDIRVMLGSHHFFPTF